MAIGCAVYHAFSAGIATWVIGMLVFDILSMIIYTTRKWQKSDRLVQKLNVCTVHKLQGSSPPQLCEDYSNRCFSLDLGFKIPFIVTFSAISRDHDRVRPSQLYVVEGTGYPAKTTTKPEVTVYFWTGIRTWAVAKNNNHSVITL